MVTRIDLVEDVLPISELRLRAAQQVNKIQDTKRPLVITQYGKAVAEILPAASGKGRVIASILDEPPYRGRRAIFVGDDLTDEHGFETVNAAGGVSVRIGGGETVATLRLPSPQALRQALSRWAADGHNPFDGPTP